MKEAQDLVKQFTPEHITEQLPADTKELVEEVEEATELKSEKPKVTPTENLKAQREYTFMFDWTSPTGKQYQGAFTNKILNIREQQSVGLARAKLAGGMPADSIDPLTKEINFMISHMTFSLIKSPKWANDLRELTELALIQEIYTEVASHEAIFFGFGETKEDS